MHVFKKILLILCDAPCKHPINSATPFSAASLKTLPTDTQGLLLSVATLFKLSVKHQDNLRFYYFTCYIPIVEVGLCPIFSEGWQVT